MAKVTAVTFNEDLISKIKSAFMGRPYRVETFSSSVQARKHIKIEEDEPTVLIVDVGVRNFGGLEILQHIRDLPNGYNARIIVMTTQTNCDFHELADGSLTKPFTTIDLIKKVEFMMGC